MLGSPPETVAHSLVVTNRSADERLGFVQEGFQVGRTLEALRVDLVNVLGAGRPGREPPARGDDLEAVYRRAVAACFGQLRDDRVAGERLFPNGFRRKRLESRL